MVAGLAKNIDVTALYIDTKRRSSCDMRVVSTQSVDDA